MKDWPIFRNLRRFEQNVARLMINAYRDAFEASGNGLFAWRAYKLSRRAKVDPPTWVLEYMDAVAKSLEKKGALKHADGKAVLGIQTKGQGDAWTQADSTFRRIETRGEFEQLVNYENMDREDVIAALAEQYKVSTREIEDRLAKAPY